MKIRITMVHGETITFTNTKFETLSSYIMNDLNKDFYIIDKDQKLAIRTSNILKVEDLKNE